MIVGTHHFVSIGLAERYYRTCTGLTVYDAQQCVRDKLQAGEIAIGKPATNPGQRVVIIDNGTRYAIVD